jgi:hypothetical protein
LSPSRMAGFLRSRPVCAAFLGISGMGGHDRKRERSA